MRGEPLLAKVYIKARWFVNW